MKEYRDTKDRIVLNSKQRCGILVAIVLSIAIIICIGIIVINR